MPPPKPICFQQVTHHGRFVAPRRHADDDGNAMLPGCDPTQSLLGILLSSQLQYRLYSDSHDFGHGSFACWFSAHPLLAKQVFPNWQVLFLSPWKRIWSFSAPLDH